MTLSTPWGLRLTALAALAALLGLAPLASAQTTVFEEGFEGPSFGYTTSAPEFNDGDRDFFTRTDGSDISSAYEVTGANGTFFAAQDLDAEFPNRDTLSIFFSNIDVQGLEDLLVGIRFAEDDDGENQDWDVSEHVRVYASVYDEVATTRQRGGEVLIFAIEDQGSTNTEPRVDTDFDGVGDGLAITSEFVGFLMNVPGTGDRLDLRIEISLEAGDEDIAIDDVSVSGTPKEMEPTVVACAVGTGLTFDETGQFDADGLPEGEFVSILNASPMPVSTAGCSFAFFDPFTEQVTSALFVEDEVVPAAGEPFSEIVFSAFPENTIPDGPGAVVLVEGSVAVGASIADVLPNLVSGMVYQSEDDIFAIYTSYAPVATSADDFLAAIASLSRSVASEEEANGIDLAVTAAPNPLRDRATIAFGVAEASDVRVAVYDALGREVALLAEAPYAAGRHELTFEANDLPAGVYVVRAVVGAEARTARVTLAR